MVKIEQESNYIIAKEKADKIDEEIIRDVESKENYSMGMIILFVFVSSRRTEVS